MRCLIVLLACALAACSSVVVLPPRHAPPRAMPAVAQPATPIPEGHGRAVIDTTDGPMDVVAQTTASFTANVAPRSGFLCRTPCAVDLPLGSYTLYFSGLSEDSSRGDVARLEVHEGLNVLRRAPGKYQTPEDDSSIGPIMLVVTGITAVTAGISMAAIMDEPAPGIAVATLGAGATVGGIALMPGRRAEQQEGATTSWNVPPAPASAPPQDPPPQVPTPQPAAEAEATTPTDGSTPP